eukprot:151238-Alexandrium_andersonii.AAC.1
MSASLVGSEMCIRDRSVRCEPLRADPLASADCAKAFRALRRSRGCGGPSPVSYTHLTLPTICSV